MKKIQVILEIEVNEEKMIENGITLNDVKSELVLYESEVLDGWELTRNNENAIEEFYLNDVSMIEVKEIDNNDR